MKKFLVNIFFLINSLIISSCSLNSTKNKEQEEFNNNITNEINLSIVCNNTNYNNCSENSILFHDYTNLKNPNKPLIKTLKNFCYNKKDLNIIKELYRNKQSLIKDYERKNTSIFNTFTFNLFNDDKFEKNLIVYNQNVINYFNSNKTKNCNFINKVNNTITKKGKSK